MAKQGQQAAAPGNSTDVLKLHADKARGGGGRQRRAALLGGGVSAIALATMLGASPALATTPTASVVISPVPASGLATGFVTGGSQQQNTSAAIAAEINAATGSSTTNGNSANPLPDTQTVTGNDLSAYATGNAQTNSVDMASIGTSATANGIAVMAGQANTNTTAGSALTTINATVTNSSLTNVTTNAINGDSLALSNNLINAQVTGDSADSSVTGVIPTDYGSAVGTPGVISEIGNGNGSASGNVVVGNSQKNNGLQAGIGSYASVTGNTIGLTVDNSGATSPQNLTASTTESGNTVSAILNGNSTTNDVGVSLTSGAATGASTLAGALTVANLQSNHRGNTTTPVYGIGAYNGGTDIYSDVTATVYPLILSNGAVTTDNNLVSATVTGNSAIGSGAAMSPGNEITLGVNLAGVTTAGQQSNSVNGNYGSGGGSITSAADLALGNIQDNNNMQLTADTQNGSISGFATNATGSSMNVSGNDLTAKVTGSLADNAINTQSDAGINLISGLAALSSVQASYNLSSETATVANNDMSGYLGVLNQSYEVTGSTLTMANDGFSASAAANQVTNGVALTASTIDAGALGAATAPAILSATSGARSSASAGVSVNTAQQSTSPVYADTASSRIFDVVAAYNVSADSVALSNAAITANATQNGANNSVNLTGSQAVSGSAGLLNSQDFSNTTNATVTDAAAETALNSVGEGSGQIVNSSEVLSGTQVSAQATGNNASNSLYVGGGQITNAAGGTFLAAQTGVEFSAAQATADLALNNVQQATALTTAVNTGVTIGTFASATGGGGISGSTFTLSGPATTPSIQSLSIGNEGVNMVTANAGSLLSDSAGLVSAQYNSGGSSAGVTNDVIAAEINSYDAGGAISNSSIAVGSGAAGGSNGNITRALAYDNQVSNTFSVSSGASLDFVSTALDLGVLGSVINTSPPLDTSIGDIVSTGVGAVYGLLNDQVAVGDASATVTGAEVNLFAGNTAENAAVSGSTLNNEGNLIVASAFGNQADNSGSISAGDLAPSETYYPAGDVTNLQSTANTASASIDNVGHGTFTTAVYGTGTVSGSTLRLSNDTALTQVEGNAANNGLSVAANNIIDASTTALSTGVSGIYASSPDAFSVQNVQYGGSNISPSQTNTNGLISVGGNVDTASLVADGNQFSSTGFSNTATNTLAFGAAGSPVNSLDTSGSVQNVQTTNGAVDVVLGTAPTAAVPGTQALDIAAVPYTVQTGNNSATISANGLTLTVSGEPLVLDLSGLTTSERTAFEAAVPGGTLSGTSYSLAANTYTLANSGLFTYNPLTSGVIYTTTGSSIGNQLTNGFTIPATEGSPATPGSPSVLVNVAGSITNSTLSADNNVFSTMAVANNATNSSNITASTVNGGADIPAGTAGASAGVGLTATVDYTVTNTQTVISAVTASSYGEAGINPTNVSSISGSSLSVSGNAQSAKAEANYASNTLSLTTTNAIGGDTVVPPTAALVSDQIGNSNVTGTSGADSLSTIQGQAITAPGAMTDSTLTMSNNSNSALALVNDAANVMDISATTLSTASTATQNATALIGNSPATTADYSLLNMQTAQAGAVLASAVSQVQNADSTNSTITGLNGSSAIITGNSTTADAYANEASSTLNMTAANSTATGALLNSQSNSDAVSASGIAQDGFALNGGTGDPAAPAALNSTIDVSNNMLQVQAVGNQTTNALNASTGATYGTQLGASSSNTSASATYAVLNSQNNSGNISANSIATAGSQYAVALNSGGSTQPVAGTTVTVSYNTMGVTAFGNSANNGMTMSALNSGNATAALQNTQTNDGNVTSNISNANFGTSIGSPGSSGITTFVGNNSISAGAVGNSAVNSIAVAH